MNKESQAYAKEAFAELYRRHAETLYCLLQKSAEGRLLEKVRSEDALSALVDDTFLRACERADTYDSGKAEVRTWLVTIARNLANDILEEESKQAGGLDQFDQGMQDLGDVAAMTLYEIGEETEYDPKRIEIIRDALEEELTEHQWELLLPYLVIQTRGESRDGADKGAVSQLANQLDTTPSALRANKSRALDKVEDYVRERVPDQVTD